MAFARNVIRTPFIQAIICLVIAGYIRLVRLTGNWQSERAEIPEALVNDGQAFLVAFWHGRLFMAAEAWRFQRPFNMVISEHPDGRLIARTVRHLGISTIAGSTTRGGSRVLRQIIRCLRNGEYAGITPDGPQGPRMRSGRGIVEAARLAGVPIVPLTYSASRCHIASSWDRLMVPYPFARGKFLWGAPIEVPRDADADAVARLAKELETTLNDMTASLDSEFAIGPVAPATAEGEAA